MEQARARRYSTMNHETMPRTTRALIPEVRRDALSSYISDIAETGFRLIVLVRDILDIAQESAINV